MGTVKLCTHEMARTPFVMEATGIAVYSIEELAYYLYENIYLIDDRILGEKLYGWIEHEIELESLAEKLRGSQGTGNHVYNQVMTILKASRYYSEEELSRLSEKIKTISGLQTQERMKFRGDEYLQNENYWAAITEYERILSIRQSSRLKVDFYAKVWNNMGGCYARLFLFEKAASCYEHAYQFQKITEYQEKAHYARKLANYGQEEMEELIEHKLSEEFMKESEEVLKALEAKSKEECALADPKEFVKMREKNYGKMSCI